MKLLLDTHILIWALTDDPVLPSAARRLICDESNTVYYSVISPWEIQIKHQAHPDKLSFGAKQVSRYCNDAGYLQLPVRLAHVLKLDSLQRNSEAPAHKDPFDRMLICQASSENMLLVTADKRIAEYADPCILPV